MKLNLFKVREMKRDKIVLEEERLKHPILFFFKKNKKIILLILTILAVLIVGLSLGIAISLVGNTGDFDISYIDGSDRIDANPDADDEEVEKELLGNIAITDGVVLVTKKFMTEKGEIVTYYSDGTSLIITSKGIIKRVAPLENGGHAINELGKIDENTIRKIVTASTVTLDDGTIITYYSDGSAEITKDQTTIFIRKSSNIGFDLNTTKQIFTKVNPSGVSLFKKITTTTQTYKYTEFFDGSVLVEKNGKKYLVHNAEDVTLTENSYRFPNNNEATIIKTSTLSDGNTIEYYSDGSAIIIAKNNDKIVVKKSGDIVIKNDTIYEIYPNKVAYKSSITYSPDKKTITYYDNGAAIIRRPDDTKEYIEDSSLIKYNPNKNIKSIPRDKKNQTIQKTLPDGTIVTNFENGKTQIIEPNGKDYIIDTKDLMFDLEGNLEPPNKPKPPEETSKTSETSTTSETSKTSETSSTSGTSGTSKTSGTGIGGIAEGELDMTEAENEWNYSKSLENSSFVITNKNKYARKFRIVIEEVKDYSLYNANPIATKEHEGAYYVRFQATFGNELIPATRLSDVKAETSDGTNSYIIYEGKLGAKSNLKANIILYFDYEPLDNSFQNKAFIGTIRLYYVPEEEELQQIDEQNLEEE